MGADRWSVTDGMVRADSDIFRATTRRVAERGRTSPATGAASGVAAADGSRDPSVTRVYLRDRTADRYGAADLDQDPNEAPGEV